ncbi:MAG: hypothetical protein M1170_00225 [Patescibacteria group bacterium]|nr:hypothetical protein [Patescibacteria group bacterium]
MLQPYQKIAQILRTDKDNIRFIDERLSAVTGKKNIIEKIVEENDATMKNRLDILGLNKNAGAKKIYNSLIRKIESDDIQLFKVLGSPLVTISSDWQHVLETTKSIAGKPKGFFLKKEKAVEFLRNQPPMKILQVLNYKNVDEMIQKENISEIFSALRFVEGSDWLNKLFFKQYENLKPDDFEEREIEVLALSERWTKIAQEFIRHKRHNISHLKEMGLIYVIPLSLEISGETLRNFSLILHYFNEIPFYADLIKKFSNDEKSFANNLISLLRGDVMDQRLSSSDKSQWLVIQRYLAKDDENDWRLFESHLNPEALHWERAEKMLVKAGVLFDGFSHELSFWQNLNWVGDYFKSDTGIDVLVSFNLIDTTMSLVKEKEMIKYLYHHQESLWNKIFMEYFDEMEMEKKMKENIIKGWFEI